MAKNKMTIEFEGFDELLSELKKLEGDAKAVAEEALLETQRIVAERANDAMKKHHRTGRTQGSIITNSAPEWEGFTGVAGVGFKIRDGGLPSIFLMYGTPRAPKDTAVYNAVYGSSTRKAIEEAQREVFLKAVAERMG